MPLIIKKDPTNPQKRVVVLKVEPTRIGIAVPPRVSLAQQVYPEMQLWQDVLLQSPMHKRVRVS